MYRRQYFTWAIAILVSACSGTHQLHEIKCVERYRWKYEDYTKKPLFANQIFTKGFSLYILPEGKQSNNQLWSDSIKTIVSAAFRTALTNWGVALMLNGDSLAPVLKQYIDDNSLKENGHSTYNAPQVFTVDCPENANFIIHIFYPSGKKFPDIRDVLAKAQVKGRTLILNMQSQHLIYSQRFFDVKDTSGAYNLVPLLAHELGHCFGLSHISTFPSVMNPIAPAMNRFPTAKDGAAFSLILQTLIQGAAPGYFSPTECAGLRTQ